MSAPLLNKFKFAYIKCLFYYLLHANLKSFNKASNLIHRIHLLNLRLLITYKNHHTIL